MPDDAPTFATVPDPIAGSEMISVSGAKLITSDPASADQPHRAARWITGATIEAFRGIPGILDLDFGQAPRPAAVVILGDNGSGKSSIVDALQCALQLQLGGARGKATLELARCELTQTLPSVQVRLSDRSTVERRFWYEDDRVRVTPEPPGDFARTPLVLRRLDVLRFWDTPAEFRQLLFVHFFSAGRVAAELPQERELRLKAAEMRAKAERRSARAKLGRLLDVSPMAVPTDMADFGSWVNIHVHGWNPQSRRRSVRAVPKAHQAAVDAMRVAMKQLDGINKELHDPAPASIGLASDLGDVLREASADVTESFLAISPSKAVTSLEMTCGEETTMELTLRATLSTGANVDPGVVLSEANRDLVAFLVFVAIAKAAARRGQARVMILDDVFQSVDAPIRVAALDRVVSELPGWQFVLTAHDRLWQEQAVTVLRRHGHPIASFEIVGWSAEGGPDLRAADRDIGTALRSAIDTGDPVGIALQAGRLVEQIAQEMSWTIPVSVVRRRGDRYTLGDLWPAVYAKLRKTNAAGAVEEVERHLHLRNLVGAHVNEWAQSASLAESVRLGEAVLGLLVAVRCDGCARWIEESPEARTYVCRCGKTRLAPQRE